MLLIAALRDIQCSQSDGGLDPMDTVMGVLPHILIYNTHPLQRRSTLKSTVVAVCVSASRLPLFRYIAY
jgi:hypothetical protein